MPSPAARNRDRTDPDAASRRAAPAWLVIWALARRELVRFVRQGNRVFGALGQPIMFWVLFAAGLGPSFRLPGKGAAEVSYGQFFFPGTVVLILLFTAIFTTISVIEDRKEGFLQGVLVAPIGRGSMVLGKIAGGAVVALVQGGLFLALGLLAAPWIGLDLHFGLLGLALAVVLECVLAVGLTALGFVFAWRTDSVQGFHAVMSVFLFPLWLLSGAFFPAADGLLGWVVRLNPLSYGVAAMRRLTYWTASDPPLPPGTPPAWLCWSVTCLSATILVAMAWRVAGRSTEGDLL